ncbi:MAG: glycosyl hydrolase [Pseudonocardiales bacterium]|nr:glycosyl hydrolase [Pseudonocardiales bacterium]
MALTVLVPAPSASAAPVLRSEGVAELASAINSYRQANGLVPLAVSASLQSQAQSCVVQLANEGGLRHCYAGEIVQYNTNPSAQAWLQAYIDSPAHNALLLTASFRSFGLGVATTDDGRWYNVVDFASAASETQPPAAAPGSPDLFIVAATGTGSGRVEVHALSRGSGYQGYTVHAATALGVVPDPGSWVFQFGAYTAPGARDLYAIHLAGTASGRVEVHVMSQASNYASWAAHIATPSYALTPAAWQVQLAGAGGDQAPNLYLINTVGTGSGRVEVHVLSRASGYQSWVVHSATAMVPGDPARVTYLVGDAAGSGDLTAIERYATGSGRTELHTVTSASGYAAYSAHAALPIGYTASPAQQFSLGRYDGDGTLDLLQVSLAGTATGRTEIHVLSGAGWSGWLLHTATPYGLPDPATVAVRLVG